MLYSFRFRRLNEAHYSSNSLHFEFPGKWLKWSSFFKFFHTTVHNKCMVETHAFFHRWNRSLHVMQILATSKSYIKQPIRSSPIFLHICTMKFKPNSCMQTVQIINWIWKRNIESKFLVTKVLRFELKFLNFERFSDQYQDSLNIIRE